MKKNTDALHAYAQLIVRRNVDGSYEVKYLHNGSTMEWKGSDIKEAVALASQRLAELFTKL